MQSIKNIIDWEKAGFNILDTFTSFDDASNYIFLNRHRIDLVITDIRLGVKTGLELIKSVQSILSPNTFYIVVSAYQDFQYAKQAIQLGVFAYIEKPIDPDELLAYLSKIQATALPNTASAKKVNPLTPKETVSEILEYSIANYTNPHFSLSDIANHFHLSAKYISSIFKRYTQQNFTNYIQKLRIEKSLELIQNTDKPLKEISISCGFVDYYYFSKVFKQLVGITPSECRQQYYNE